MRIVSELLCEDVNIKFRKHPVYDLYAGSKCGKYIHVKRKVINSGCQYRNGSSSCMIRSDGGKQKKYFLHRFIWECYNGLIPDGLVIDHINDILDDSRLCNLQLVTQQENCLKSAKKRDYLFAIKNHQNRKCVKATNVNTQEVVYFNSMHAVQQHLGINAGIVKMVCERINNCKTGISTIDGQPYEFEYVSESDMPANYKKSANERPRKLTEETKKEKHKIWQKCWAKKKYTCLQCNKTITNGSKYLHNKSSGLN